MRKLNITDLIAEDCIAHGSLDEIKHQLCSMIDQVAATPYAMLYGSIAIHDPNTQMVQHAAFHVDKARADREQLNMYGSTITFVTHTESQIAYDSITDAIGGFFILAADECQHMVVKGYEEFEQEILLLEMQ